MKDRYMFLDYLETLENCGKAYSEDYLFYAIKAFVIWFNNMSFYSLHLILHFVNFAICCCIFFIIT